MWDSGQGLVEQVGALRRQVTVIRARLEGSALADAANAQGLAETKDKLVAVCGQREKELNDFAATDNWNNLTGIARRCRALAADCLALEHSASLRANKTAAAAAVCAAADRIAGEFSKKTGKPRVHYALVSEAEHFGADASAIHLGYMRLDAWNLSRAVHEFGHLWSEEFSNGPGGAQPAFLGALGGKWSEALGKEFFADIVATFMTGPAYAYSCLLLDFNPADRTPSDTHPSGDERAHCILTALEQLEQKFQPITRPQMKMLAQELRQFWSAARTAAGVAGAVGNAIDLEYAVGIAMQRLQVEIPNARYGDLSLANAVNINLAKPQGSRPALASGSDILNGAWLRRRAAPAQEAAIGKKTLAMLTSK